MDLFYFAHTQPLGGVDVPFDVDEMADLGNPWVDPFHIAHTHPLGGVNVPFGVYKV